MNNKRKAKAKDDVLDDRNRWVDPMTGDVSDGPTKPAPAPPTEVPSAVPITGQTETA